MEREYMHAEAGPRGASGSPWLVNEVPGRSPVTGDVSADVLVIGAGITGALVTAELASRGLEVALIERRRIAGGATGHSTAKITVMHDVSWTTRLSRRGLSPQLAEWARLNAASPAAMSDVVGSRGIDCGFRMLDAHLVAATGRSKKHVSRALRAFRRLGVEVGDLERVPESPLGAAAGIRIADQAIFDPAAFTVGLIDSLPQRQVMVAESSPVRRLAHLGGSWSASLDYGTVRAPRVVMTALAPVRDPALLFTRLYPYAAYALEFMPCAPAADGLWIQAADEGLTLRPKHEPDGPWVASGQSLRLASHDDETTVYRRLFYEVESRFPSCRPMRYWSTQDFSTPDLLPYVGQVGRREGLYMIGGFGGWGMSAALPAARMVADAISGSPNTRLLEYLSPDRLPGLWAMPGFLRENAIVARHLLMPSRSQRHADWTPDVTVADAGRRPPRCTHMGCRLKVDTAEATLDCPCHGSRFTGDGAALYGPARRDLHD